MIGASLQQVNIIPRSEHEISRKSICENALKVLYRLRGKGYWAFLVGGAPRDLLRGRTPRDYDVATNASIAEIRKLFRNSRSIGKRFPIVHTYFGNDLVEVSTLKAEDGQDKYETLREDALRRDFTVNTILYDINDFTVVDPLGAIEHLKNGLVVPIGDVDEKFEEDPIRMLRAVKLLVKQGMRLDKGVAEAIHNHVHRLHEVGPGRRYEELTRILLDKQAHQLVEVCQKYKLFGELWPQGERLFADRDLDLLDEMLHEVPVHYSRGSYAKQAHTHLWLNIYMKSGYFEPSTCAGEIKTQLDDFIAPLGMPFRQPLIETLWALSFVKMGKPLPHLTPEVGKLLKYYLEHNEPALMERMPESFRKTKKSEKRRNPRRRGGQRKRRHRGREKRREKE